jgi:hypothetical protein
MEASATLKKKAGRMIRMISGRNKGYFESATGGEFH